MAKTSKKIGSVAAVILGCIGAGFLVYYGIAEFINFISGFKLSKGIFQYFFGPELMCLAVLTLGITFFVTIIKDLSYIRKGVTVFSLAVAAIVFFCYGVIVFNSFPPSFSTSFWENILMLVLLIGYVTYFIYNLGTKKISGFAWVMCFIGVSGLFIVNCVQLYMQQISTGTFIHDVFSALAHYALFYCGLKKY